MTTTCRPNVFNLTAPESPRSAISPPVSSPKPLYVMAPPVTGEANLPLQNSNIHILNNSNTSIYDSAEDDFTISQLAKSKTSFHKPPSPPTSASVLVSLFSLSLSMHALQLYGKRRKSKPVRYGVSTTVAEKIHSPPKPNVVVHNPSSNSMSSPKENSATKCSKSPVEKSPAMIRAEEIQSTLGTKHPSCIRLIVKSHIGSGYWMGMPQPFSKMFLPKTDSDMAIEDENGEIHHLKYIANKNGLSAGWKKFANDHKLLEGDVLIFHLVEPFKFKVYIIRANDINKVPDLETDTPSQTTKKRKQEIVSEVLEGSRPSKPELKTLQDFHIMVKGQCIDSELPEDVRMGYYKLCISRKELLHDNLPEGLYDKLVAGMIGETVNIANEIKNCKLTVTTEEFNVWDNSLKSFEILGMKVGFLRDRIGKLCKIVLESECRFDIQRFNEAKNEKKQIEDEIDDVAKKLVGLKERCGKLDGIVGGLKEKVGRHEVKFLEEVDAPW
ncbi:hypothetical protein L1887_31531 [Cichorium endivia]|nr:hypothetical protein L1887_31531 [Cichorium endivia]